MNGLHDNTAVSVHQLIEVLKSELDLIEINSATRWRDIGWHVPPGSRNDFEINYFVGGKAGMTLAGVTCTALPGEIFITDNSRGNDCESGSFTLYFFSFGIKDMGSRGRDAYQKIKNCFSGIPPGVNPGINERMIWLFNEMAREISLKRYGYDWKLKYLAIQIFIELARAIEPAASNITPYQYKKYSNLVSEIMAALQENDTDRISLDDLGNRYGLNPRYLNRIFKNAAGLPIMQYYQRTKLEKAKRLLSASSLSILEIAVELGFESSQSFCRFFKKAAGITPTAYRKLREV